MKDKYRLNIRFIIEVIIYEITDINESIKNIKNEKFEGVNEEVSKKKRAFNTKFK